MSVDSITDFAGLPRAYRGWIMLDRHGRRVAIETVKGGGYLVEMFGRFAGRQTRLRVPFSPDDMRKAVKAAGIIHVYDSIAEAMVRRYNANAVALNRLSTKELRKLEKTGPAKILDFSHPRRHSRDVPPD
jgi:hypothetical protein